MKDDNTDSGTFNYHRTSAAPGVEGTCDFSDPNIIGYVIDRYGSSPYYLRISKIYNSASGVTQSTIEASCNYIDLNYSLMLRRLNLPITANTKTIATGYALTYKTGVTGISYLTSIKSVDRSNSKLIQIVELPYLPDNSFVWTGNVLSYDVAKWRINGNREIQLVDYASEFENELRTINLSGHLDTTIVTTTESAFKNLSRSYVENTLGIKDSKFLNSDLYTYKIGYNTEEMEIKLQDVIPQYNLYGQMPEYKLTFKPSNTLSNQFGFKYDLQKGLYNNQSNVDNVIISSADTKQTLYSSAWLDYIRNGKAQDNTNAVLSTITSGLSFGAAITNAVVAGAKGYSTTGLTGVAAASAVSSLAVSAFSAVSNITSTWTSLRNKRNELKAQATSVNCNSSIDLLDWYEGNKLYIYTYEPEDIVIQGYANLFYYCGYAVNKQGIPNTNSRYWFNFVQCDAIIDSLKYKHFIDDIKARWSNGITVLHNNGGVYDWNQEKANWQTSLFN